jgi:hypothetical protein
MATVFSEPKTLLVVILFAVLLAAISPTIYGFWGWSHQDSNCDENDSGRKYFFYIFTPEVEHCVGHVKAEDVADAFSRLMPKFNFDKIMEMFFRALVGQGPMP